MKGTLSFNKKSAEGLVVRCDYLVEVVEPVASQGVPPETRYTPINATAVEKHLNDSLALHLPIPLGVQVLKRTESV